MQKCLKCETGLFWGWIKNSDTYVKRNQHKIICIQASVKELCFPSCREMPSIITYLKNWSFFKIKETCNSIIGPDETGYGILLEKTSLQLMFSLKMSDNIFKTGANVLYYFIKCSPLIHSLFSQLEKYVIY